MLRIARDLREAGLINDVCMWRCGASESRVNLGLTMCRGEIVVILDIDTTLDRDALEMLVPYFSDPRVGGVGGDLGMRNGGASVVTRCQQIEYLHRDLSGPPDPRSVGLLTIVSGAFGAFPVAPRSWELAGRTERSAEDADLTMKLRRAGWRIRFRT